MRKIKGGIIAAMVVLSLIVFVNIVSAPILPSVVWVDDDYPTGEDTDGDAYFKTIQAAVNNVAAGGTVYVAAGHYTNTPIQIYTSVSLIGKGASVTIIGSITDEIYISGAITVNISGFTVQNGTCGIAYRNSSSGIMKNNVITGNTSHGVCIDGSSPTIVHNTIDNNNGDGIHILCGSSPIIKNNIVSSNGNGGIVWDITGAPVSGYNDVWNNGVNYVNIMPGLGAISQNPQFAGIGNYHLTGSSPCIDAGTDVGVYTDMDSDTRPQGTGFDIGADEYPQAAVNLIVDFMPVKNYHLTQVNALLGKVEGALPSDVPEDIQTLLDEVQKHINNANTTNNSIYANNELLRALKLLEQVLSQL